ncbi:MAG: hypothetical protein LUP97_07570 [Methanoregula sp.]|nr:hypothetical protein [Methanoregula sp.]
MANVPDPSPSSDPPEDLEKVPVCSDNIDEIGPERILQTGCPSVPITSNAGDFQKGADTVERFMLDLGNYRDFPTDI